MKFTSWIRQCHGFGLCQMIFSDQAVFKNHPFQTTDVAKRSSPISRELLAKAWTKSYLSCLQQQLTYLRHLNQPSLIPVANLWQEKRQREEKHLQSYFAFPALSLKRTLLLGVSGQGNFGRRPTRIKYQFSEHQNHFVRGYGTPAQSILQQQFIYGNS